MSDIYFQCDCGNFLAVDKTGIGQQIACPHCNKPIVVPKPSFRFACAKCGKEILASEKMAGFTITCLDCDAENVVPRVESPGDVIQFECPSCKQPMDAPLDMAGEQIECPNCNKNLTIPAKCHKIKMVQKPSLRKEKADISPAAALPAAKQSTDGHQAANVPESKPKLRLVIKGASKPGAPAGSKKVANSSAIDNNKKATIATRKQPGFTTKKKMLLVGGIAFVIIAGIACALTVLWLRSSRSTPSSQATPGATNIVAGLNNTNEFKPHAVKPNISENITTNSGPPLVYQTIHEATKNGDLADIKRHLQRSADVNAKDQAGKTPLMLTHNQDILKLLLASGADVNAKDQAGKTPLMLTHDPDMLKFFLANGADVNAKDNRGITPLMMDVELALIASRSYLNMDSTYMKEVLFLISKGADVNARDNESVTPLTLTIEYEGQASQLQMLKFLVDHGADVHEPDKDGKTPLMKAEDLGNSDVVEFLKQNGAKK